MVVAIGIVLALSVGLFATALGLDRDRAFYPTVMIVIAILYGLFAVMGGSVDALLRESVPMAAFIIAAAIGFKRSLWLVVAALVAHGAFDFGHHFLITNPGVPVWWPSFCSAYDVTAGLYLAMLMLRRNHRATA